jgi:hypothetical protein
MIIILHTKKLIYLTRRICTLQRGPNCLVTVLEFRIESCDLFLHDNTNKFQDQLAQIMIAFSNHNLISIYQSLEAATAEQNIVLNRILNLIQTILMKYNTVKLYFWIYFNGPQHVDHVGWVARGNTIWTWHIPRVKHDLHGEDQPWRTIDSTTWWKSYWKGILIF